MMNKYGNSSCRPHKHRPKRKCDNKYLGIIMALLGAVTLMVIFLPMKLWVLILSAALVVFGIHLCSR
ncbi:MAG: hypothetical protein IJA50_01695 [Firmicutes bacterium]|nr:hypothetical protein [Bacillota bacterium]